MRGRITECKTSHFFRIVTRSASYNKQTGEWRKVARCCRGQAAIQPAQPHHFEAASSQRLTSNRCVESQSTPCPANVFGGPPRRAVFRRAAVVCRPTGEGCDVVSSAVPPPRLILIGFDGTGPNASNRGVDLLRLNDFERVDVDAARSRNDPTAGPPNEAALWFNRFG